jgi:hypothetical protein
MRLARFLLIFLLTGLPTAVVAGLSNGDLPAARWYAHIDLVEMRSAEGGKYLYEWLDDEVFEELHDEIGFDAGKEADTITALATPEGGIMIVIDGEFTQMTQDRIVAIGATGSEFNSLKYEDNVYYFVGDDDGHGEHNHENDSLDDGAYMSLSVNNKLIVTSTEEQMHKLLDSDGDIPGDYDSGDSLIVLSAEQVLVQAGMSADGIGEDLGWDSNMLKNTKQVALVVADDAGKLSIEAQLITAEEELANSLASIVRGLISLQVFNDDLDPELTEFLQNTTVEVDGVILTVKLAMDAESLVDVID